MASVLIQILFALAALVWGLVAALGLLGALAVPSLPRSRREAAPGGPRVAVIVPARDEALRIGSTVGRLLAQRGVDLRVIVVDDRSSDGTGDAAMRAAAGDARCEVVRVDTLPGGWLGKCNACHVGAQRAVAEGVEWLLFSDADAWHSEDVVARALGAATARDSEHVVLIPGFTRPTLLAQGALAAALLGYLKDALLVNSGAPWAYIGGGAFCLTSVGAYSRAGGHEALRMEVVDDIGLGALLRRSGARSLCFAAPRDVEVHWIDSARAFVRLLEKNFFALQRFSLVRSVGFCCGFAGAWALCVVGPFTGTVAGWAAGAALLALVVPTGVVSVRWRWSPLAALVSPFAAIIIVPAFVNSIVRTLLRGGVRWRDTFYPLDALRRGVVR